MSKARNIVGVITGGVLVLSAGAHSFLGWRSLRQQLVQSGAPPELITGLGIGWHFAGMSILVFGLMAIAVFTLRLRGREAPLWIPRLIAVVYTIFGIAAYQVAKDRFFLTIFVVPGVLLALSAWGTDADAETE